MDKDRDAYDPENAGDGQPRRAAARTDGGEGGGAPSGAGGAFAGAVMLAEPEWDRDRFVRDLREKWGVAGAEAPAPGGDDGRPVVLSFRGMALAAEFIPGRVPDALAEGCAENDFMWPEAPAAAAAHKAHVFAVVPGGGENPIERAKLLVAALAALCGQRGALGVLYAGSAFEPRFYEAGAAMIKEGRLPVYNLIRFDVYRGGDGLNACTRGMDAFGAEELEVVGSEADPAELREFLARAAAWALENGAEFRDGGSVSFGGEERYAIARGPGVSLPEEVTTVKISYEGQGSRARERYTPEEREAIEKHIERYFGPPENAIRDLLSPDIRTDVLTVPPREGRNCLTLVTAGMGARRMNVPAELADRGLERAELVVALPADWKLDRESLKDERRCWPVRLLQSLARLPLEGDAWLGLGHTVENGGPFAENTKFCAVLLIGPQGAAEGAGVCVLPGGEKVNFYQVIPLYWDETEYKLAHDAAALLEKMEGMTFVADPGRPSALARSAAENGDFDGPMDDASWHLEDIEKKKLPVDPLSAYSHMAIWLRWCLERDLMSPGFLTEHGEAIRRIRADPARSGLREFIRDELGGLLEGPMFGGRGRAFAGYYYNSPVAPYFPSDIDDYALKYFGPARYHSGEFRDEAYLFVPFDENYYRDMAKVIDERFANWLGQEIDGDTLEPSAVALALRAYLGCECEYFPSMADDDPVASAYGYARREAPREGFVPVLVRADDETLLESLVINADPDHENDPRKFDPEAVAAYRRETLAAPVAGGEDALAELRELRAAEAGDDGADREEEFPGEMTGGSAADRLASYWNEETDMTHPLILAKIPVKNPWEIFAYLPFGNWNDCPDTPELTAVAKYWFKKYGAVPAVVSGDGLEFVLPAPVPEEEAAELAEEQRAFCPDVLDDYPKDAGAGALADSLRQSVVWRFRWR